MKPANRGAFLGQFTVFIALSGLIHGCGGMYGDHVSKYGRPLSDPNAPPATVTIKPEHETSPISTPQTFTAIVKNARGKPVFGAMVEWILARANGAVGDIVVVKQDPMRRALKMTNTYALAGTNRRGEAAITITSVQEGTTHLIAVVPEIKNTDQQKTLAVMNWLDAQWEFPQDQSQKVGSARTLAATVRTASTGEPLSGYQVKWNITAGPPATFEESGQPEAITETDEHGVAKATLTQRTPGPGGNLVHIAVIKPKEPGRECCPAVSGVIAQGTSSTEWVAPSISIQHNCPSSFELGDTAQFHFVVANTSDIEATDVTVTSALPSGLVYEKATPSASVQDDTLRWHIESLPANTSQDFTLNLKSTSSGTLTNEVTVTTGDGVQKTSTCTTKVGEAKLTIAHTCSNQGTVGDTLPFTVTVQNTGTGTAQDLTITNPAPQGMHHASGQPEVSRTIPSLAPGATISETFEIMADHPGTVTNTIRVTAGPRLLKEVRCNVTIQDSQLEISMMGPKKRFLNTLVTYDIVVSNQGSGSAKEVMVNTVLPAGVQYESSNPEGMFNSTSREVFWSQGTVAPGEAKTLTLTGRAVTEGLHCTSAKVKTDRRRQESPEICTIIEGVPALHLNVIDNPDPVEIGTTTTYTINVTNQGTAESTNIAISAILPEELKYESSTGSTARLVVMGKRVDFDPIPVLALKDTLTYTVTVRGVKSGDVRFRVEMNADQLTGPVIEEESTNVYQ